MSEARPLTLSGDPEGGYDDQIDRDESNGHIGLIETRIDEPETDMIEPALKDVLVVEIGTRLSAAICGSVLAQLGATVVVPEFPSQVSWSKTSSRSQFMAGKLSIALGGDQAEDRTIIDDLQERFPALTPSGEVATGSASRIILP